MAEASPVSGTWELINKLISTATQQIDLGWGVEDDELDKLRHTLTTIQVVVHAAEKKQVEENEAIRLWLRMLKNVAHDADDLLDEFAYEHLRRKVEVPNPRERNQTNRGIRKVHNINNVSHSIDPNNFCLMMTRKIKEINRKFDEFKKEAIGFGLTTMGSLDKSSKNKQNRETYSFIDDSKVVGRVNDKSKIIDMLTSVNGKVFSVIPIVGMGGLGKTTLAQSIYNDKLMERHFDERVWVCVSEDFDVKRLLGEITESTTRNICDLPKMDTMLNKVHERLKEKRFLLVLDDVWNEDHHKWETLKDSLQIGVVGSTVIVTTRSHEVSRIMNTGYTHYLESLSEEECWSLFRQRAFGDGGAQETPNLVAIGKDIVKKCGGVPLAAKVLGSLMHTKKEEHEWLSIEESEIWNLPKDKIGILPALKLSYDRLPSHLKQCFAYCSIFPKDHIIDKQTLIRLWMAEGFLKQRKTGKLMKMEDVGEEYFNNLLWSSMFQDVQRDEYGDVRACKIHDLVHDLAQSIAGFEFSVMKASELRYFCEIRGLSLLSNEDISAIQKYLNIKAKNLRTIIFNCHLEGYSFKVFANMLLKFSSLRVLNLNSTGITELPSSIGKLKHLRYLDLSCTRIKALPESITGLYNLQTLNLEDCFHLLELPKEMRNMISLRHLVLDTMCIKWDRMPVGLGRLSCLQTLPIFIVGKDRGHCIKELQFLNLKGHLKISHLENASGIEAKEVNLKGKQDIRSLQFVWNINYGEVKNYINVNDVLEGLQPHRNLRSLEIISFDGDKFPTWMNNASLLPNLVEVKLYNCYRCKYVSMPGELPNLRVLKMQELASVECLGTSIEATRVAAFPSLKELSIVLMSNLREWLEVFPSFPCLEDLDISYCPVLKVTPTLFPSLKKLKFDGRSLVRSVQALDNPYLPGLLQANANVLQDLAICNYLAQESIIPDEEGVGPPLIMPCLESLKIENCPVLRSLPNLWGWTSIKYLSLSHLENLKSMPEGFQCLTKLKTLCIGEFSKELDYIPGVEDLQHLVSLSSLLIRGWPKLNTLPDQFKHLTQLVSLTISTWDGLVDLPEWLENLVSLQDLSICFCKNLMSLPEEAMRRLTLLERVYIYGCPNLKERYTKQRGEEWHKKLHIP